MYCRRIGIDSFITHFFDSYSNQEQILMHEGNSEQLYYIFLHFCSSKEQTFMFPHFLELLYHTFVESSIDQEHILIDKVIF